MSRLISLCICPLLVFLAVPSAYSQDLEWRKYTESDLLDQKNKNPVVIYFWAEWCAPCHQLRKLTLSNLEVKNELKKYTLFKVDCTDETPETEKIQKKYNIESLPVIVFIDKNGNVQKKHQLSGFEPPVEFLQRLKKLN